MAVFRAGPQLRALAGSVPRWTSTTSVGWQCSPPDINRELRLALFPAGPQHTIHNHNHKQANKQTNHKHIHKQTTTNTQSQAQPQTPSQTHNHRHDHKHNHKHTHTQPQTHNHKHNQKHSHKHTTNWRPWRQGSTFGCQLETLGTPRRELPDIKITVPSPRTHKQNPKPQSPRPWQRAPHHA